MKTCWKILKKQRQYNFILLLTFHNEKVSDKMARITVEDCVTKIPNHFDLTLTAARRARQLENGTAPLVDDVRNNKPTVTALREIAAGEITTELLKRSK